MSRLHKDSYFTRTQECPGHNTISFNADLQTKNTSISPESSKITFKMIDYLVHIQYNTTNQCILLLIDKEGRRNLLYKAIWYKQTASTVERCKLISP